jgi:hypothetical protein
VEENHHQNGLNGRNPLTWNDYFAIFMLTIISEAIQKMRQMSPVEFQAQDDYAFICQLRKYKPCDVTQKIVGLAAGAYYWSVEAKTAVLCGALCKR